MHRDQKIGLSLGVLLVGFAGAFCFRNEPLGPAHPLAVEHATVLDTRIEQLPVRAYTQREGVGNLRRQPDLLVASADLVDASFIDRPIQAIALEGDTVTGDVVELFVGPPEPMRAVRPETVATGHVSPTPGPERESATRTAAARPQPNWTTEPVQVISPDLEKSPQPPAPGTGGVPPERTYVVKSGDTLSGVSLRMYGTVGRYLEIFQANRDVLRDPDDLPTGTTLRIPQSLR